jgi:hypothetical protein
MASIQIKTKPRLMLWFILPFNFLSQEIKEEQDIHALMLISEQTTLIVVLIEHRVYFGSCDG